MVSSVFATGWPSSSSTLPLITMSASGATLLSVVQPVTTAAVHTTFIQRVILMVLLLLRPGAGAHVTPRLSGAEPMGSTHVRTAQGGFAQDGGSG